jgi:two-component system LytT family response regulator
LSAYESILPSRKFYRCHHSYLINLDETKLYVKGENLVIVSNNEQIPVARDRKDGLWQAIQNNSTE